ncbi:hypothetical protein A6F55_19110 [Prescottella equi]|uniref:hypothetical protein n=1 Tax=Rhodococcus hoagii TaxID=43767 RepID=UPI000A1068AD|nr:hypothetical protein [Prescottella equi]ORL01803.1 hypothetical protein A6F55_19110 [Prescottella equi]
MSPRDELADLISKAYSTAIDDRPIRDPWGKCADAIRAAGYSRPRVVETAEELGALPHKVIVESHAGSIAARFDDEHGVIFGDDRPFPWMRLALPVTILRMPKEQP